MLKSYKYCRFLLPKRQFWFYFRSLYNSFEWNLHVEYSDKRWWQLGQNTNKDKQWCHMQCLGCQWLLCYHNLHGDILQQVTRSRLPEETQPEISRLICCTLLGISFRLIKGSSSRSKGWRWRVLWGLMSLWFCKIDEDREKRLLHVLTSSNWFLEAIINNILIPY